MDLTPPNNAVFFLMKNSLWRWGQINDWLTRWRRLKDHGFKRQEASVLEPLQYWWVRGSRWLLPGPMGEGTCGGRIGAARFPRLPWAGGSRLQPDLPTSPFSPKWLSLKWERRQKKQGQEPFLNCHFFFFLDFWCPAPVVRCSSSSYSPFAFFFTPLLLLLF